MTRRMIHILLMANLFFCSMCCFGASTETLDSKIMYNSSAKESMSFQDDDNNFRYDKQETKSGLGFGFEVDCGDTYLIMDDISKYIRSQYSSYDERSLHNGFYVGMSGGMTLFNGILEFGPRVEYIHANSQVSYDHYTYYSMGGFDGFWVYDGTYTNQYDLSLVPITFGVRLRTPGAISVVGSADVGGGFASYTFTDGYTNNSFTATGSCPVFEGRVGIRFGQQYHVQFDAGYRQAMAENMTDGMPNLEFSGLIAGGRLGIDF